MRHLKRILALSACLVMLAGLSLPHSGGSTTTTAAPKEINVRGYITNVTGPNAFEIDYYKVTRDESVKLELEHESAELKFKPEDIRVGAEVEVRGAYNEVTDELKASKIKIDLEQFRKFKMTAVLNREPEGLEQTPEGWRGVFFPDGHRVRVETTTQVLFKLNKSEEKAEKQKAKEEKKKKEQEAKSGGDAAKTEADEAKADAKAEEDELLADTEKLKSIKDVGVGMVMTYEGTEQPDGSVLADRVVFMRNELEKGEQSLWKSLKLKEKAPNFAQGKPGELKIEKVGKFKLLPNQDVQTYVTNLGTSLIPSYQRMLPDTNPQKIPFKFYVVQDKTANAFALPNGVVVVNSGMFDVLENEAQLAAVVSHEIAHSTQEHTWRQMNKDKKKRTALKIGGFAAAMMGYNFVQDITDMILLAMINGYQRTLENQADRVGLEYLVDAGYDPREAPQVWKLMAKKYGDNKSNFWSSHENHMKRRTYLMIELRNNYSQIDMSAMKRGAPEEFHRIATLAKEATEKKKKEKKEKS